VTEVAAHDAAAGQDRVPLACHIARLTAVGIVARAIGPVSVAKSGHFSVSQAGAAFAWKSPLVLWPPA